MNGSGVQEKCKLQKSAHWSEKKDEFLEIKMSAERFQCVNHVTCSSPVGLHFCLNISVHGFDFINWQMHFQSLSVELVSDVKQAIMCYK